MTQQYTVTLFSDRGETYGGSYTSKSTATREARARLKGYAGNQEARVYKTLGGRDRTCVAVVKAS